MVLHGVLAVATVLLVLLSNLGVVENEAAAATSRPDRSRPLIGARVPGRQRLHQSVGAVAFVVRDERCSVGFSARLGPRGARLALPYTRGIAAAGQLLRLRAPLTSRAARALRRRGSPVRMRLARRACDGAGNCTRLMRRTVPARC